MQGNLVGPCPLSYERKREDDRLGLSYWTTGSTGGTRHRLPASRFIAHVALGARIRHIVQRCMGGFELQFPPSEIAALAGRFSYADDATCRAAGASARTRGHYTRDEFIAICAWKTARSRARVASNDSDAIESATRRAFSTDDEAVRAEALTSLRGVGIPTASALLHFAFPEDYPILDVRALESLGRKSRTVYPVSYWLEYLSACRALAREHRVSIRTLDKALWQSSKERRGRATPVSAPTTPSSLRR